AVTFLLLLAGGDTLNILTLGALTISIGRIVDDSIVVIENIRRHLSYGEPKKEAIVTAVREVGTAITSATLASVAVFLPIAFTSGVVGELFRPFALTVTVAILASLAVALIIIPVLSYWFLSAPKGQGTEELRQEADRRERRTVLQRLYVPTLRGSLRHPVITLVLAVAVFGGTLAMVPRMETNFLASPGQDTLAVTQSFEVGASLESQDERARQVEETLLDVDGVTAVQTTVGSGGGPEQAFVGSGATPTAQFAVSLDSERDGVELEQDVRSALSDLDGVGELQVSADMGAVGASTVDLVVQAEDGAELARATEDLRAAVAELDEVGEVTSNLATEQPVLAVRVDDDAAALAGLTQGEVVGQVAAVT
ncbi:efflux RND transporter permease subunit, partial [Georgenia sp. 10Sc9-8]|nr:efflux RND transporter permease subunit [Georgenia halotolerans]